MAGSMVQSHCRWVSSTSECMTKRFVGREAENCSCIFCISFILKVTAPAS